MTFRSVFAETIFNNKYKHEECETWPDLCRTLVEDVCREHLTAYDKGQLIQYMIEMKFIPAGRYLYYAGRQVKAFNNCYLLKSEEDSREDWANLSWKAESCLSYGGGIGNDYSVYRAKNTLLKRTGGVASGPVSKMRMTNEIGREVQQGGSRRSAIYASLNWKHDDIPELLTIKDWQHTFIPGTDLNLAEVKRRDFNFPAPLDMTNISINYDDEWLENKFYNHAVFRANVKQAMSTGEPGFSFNFGKDSHDTLRNACTEVCSADDSDVCNLGTVNFSRIANIEELASVVELATKFLLCGTLVADVPYPKVDRVRTKNRRLGLGIMGVHEWLIQRNSRYEVTPELHNWLRVYANWSTIGGTKLAEKLGISTPVAFRAIAPTGTIGILAGTSTGIEPIFAVAYKRRYVIDGTSWRYQYVIDSAAQLLIDEYSVEPDNIESALSLARDWDRRIAFQADVQDYVDMCISSTINLPAWGSPLNNEDTVDAFATLLSSYAPRLRGFTCYPQGARGGQPLTAVPYREARASLGIEFEEGIGVETHDICEISGQGGSCGV